MKQDYATILETRKQERVICRAMACYWIRRKYGKKFPLNDLGKWLGHVDHTSVLRMIETMEDDVWKVKHLIPGEELQHFRMNMTREMVPMYYISK